MNDLHLRGLIDDAARGRSDASLERESDLAQGTIRNYAPRDGARRVQSLPPPDVLARLGRSLDVPPGEILNAAAADLGIVERTTRPQTQACDALRMLDLHEQSAVAEMLVRTVALLMRAHGPHDGAARPGQPKRAGPGTSSQDRPARP